MKKLKSFVRSVSPFARRPSKDEGEKSTERARSDSASSVDPSTYTWDLDHVDVDKAIHVFYKRYNPEKAQNVGYILEKFRGEEIVLLQQMCGKYCLSQNEMQRFLDSLKSGEEDEEEPAPVSQEQLVPPSVKSKEVKIPDRKPKSEVDSSVLITKSTRAKSAVLGKKESNRNVSPHIRSQTINPYMPLHYSSPAIPPEPVDLLIPRKASSRDDVNGAASAVDSVFPQVDDFHNETKEEEEEIEAYNDVGMAEPGKNQRNNSVVNSNGSGTMDNIRKSSYYNENEIKTASTNRQSISRNDVVSHPNSNNGVSNNEIYMGEANSEHVGEHSRRKSNEIDRKELTLGNNKENEDEVKQHYDRRSSNSVLETNQNFHKERQFDNNCEMQEISNEASASASTLQNQKQQKQHRHRPPPPRNKSPKSPSNKKSSKSPHRKHQEESQAQSNSNSNAGTALTSISKESKDATGSNNSSTNNNNKHRSMTPNKYHDILKQDALNQLMSESQIPTTTKEKNSNSNSNSDPTLAEELEKVKNELLKTKQELKQVKSDRAEVLSLLEVVSNAPANFKGVLQTYLENYGDRSTSDSALADRMVAALERRRSDQRSNTHSKQTEPESQVDSNKQEVNAESIVRVALPEKASLTNLSVNLQKRMPVKQVVSVIQNPVWNDPTPHVDHHSVTGTGSVSARSLSSGSHNAHSIRPTKQPISLRSSRNNNNSVSYDDQQDELDSEISKSPSKSIRPTSPYMRETTATRNKFADDNSRDGEAHASEWHFSLRGSGSNSTSPVKQSYSRSTTPNSMWSASTPGDLRKTDPIQWGLSLQRPLEETDILNNQHQQEHPQHQDRNRNDRNKRQQQLSHQEMYISSINQQSETPARIVINKDRSRPSSASRASSVVDEVDDWIECFDPKSRRKYYHSVSRKKSSWVKPEASSGGGSSVFNKSMSQRSLSTSLSNQRSISSSSRDPVFSGAVSLSGATAATVTTNNTRPSSASSYQKRDGRNHMNVSPRKTSQQEFQSNDSMNRSSSSASSPRFKSLQTEPGETHADVFSDHYFVKQRENNQFENDENEAVSRQIGVGEHASNRKVNIRARDSSPHPYHRTELDQQMNNTVDNNSSVGNRSRSKFLISATSQNRRYSNSTEGADLDMSVDGEISNIHFQQSHGVGAGVGVGSRSAMNLSDLSVSSSRPNSRPSHRDDVSSVSNSISMSGDRHKRIVTPSGWASAVDPKSQKIYWYNKGTRETTWKRPPDA